MYRIVKREQFGPVTFLWDVEAPAVARAARPGHFFMVRIDETGERIPLTIADFDPGRGTLTVGGHHQLNGGNDAVELPEVP